MRFNAYYCYDCRLKQGNCSMTVMLNLVNRVEPRPLDNLANKLLSPRSRLTFATKVISQSGFSVSSKALNILKPLGEGILGGIIGVCNWRTGVQELKNSLAINDSEGVQRSNLKINEGRVGIAGVLLFGIQKGCEYSPTAAASIAGISFGFASIIFSAISAIIGLSICLLGIVRCWKFRNELKDLSETQLIDKLNFLKNGSPVDRAQTKRRTSSKALSLIEQHASTILQDIQGQDPNGQDPNRKIVGIENGRKLIEIVRRESLHKALLYGIGAAVSMLYLAAIVSGVACSFGMLPILLSLVSMLFWLIFYINQWIAPLVKHYENNFIARPVGV